MNEIWKLAALLYEAGIINEHEHKSVDYGAGYYSSKITVYDAKGNPLWRAELNRSSIGHEKGLLEVSGTLVNAQYGDKVMGWLTAEEVMELHRKKYGYTLDQKAHE